MAADSQYVALQTEEGYFLRFLVEEVPKMKKGAVGVRGIRLKKDDSLHRVYLFEEGSEMKAVYKDKEVALNRLKIGRRDTQGIKSRI